EAMMRPKSADAEPRIHLPESENVHAEPWHHVREHDRNGERKQRERVIAFVASEPEPVAERKEDQRAQELVAAKEFQAVQGQLLLRRVHFRMIWPRERVSSAF